MTRTKPHRFLTLLCAGAAALALLGAGAVPASATPVVATSHSPRHIDYVNLGDSYSAGFGSGTVIPGPFPGCLQGSGPTHVTTLASLPNVELSINAACAGATTSGIAATIPAVARQLAGAELVTLTLGANDLDIRGLLAACSTQGTDRACNRALLTGALTIPFVGFSARSTLRALDKATSGRILVLGYPRLFSPENGDQYMITAKRATQLNRLDDLLNLAVRAATLGTNATFVSVTSRFIGHGLGSADPWIYFNPANLNDPFNLHPTTAGYLEGYYPAVHRQLQYEHLVH